MSQATVQALGEALWPRWSDKDVARELAVSPSTARRRRASLALFTLTDDELQALLERRLAALAEAEALIRARRSGPR